VPRACALALAAIVATAACHTMRPMTRAQWNTGSPPSRVWVTGADRATVRIDAPELNGDTLTGIVNGEPERILLADVISIRARRSAPARTAIVAVVVGGATFAGLWYMEHRPDVGDAQICTNGILDMGVAPGSQYIPCCVVEQTSPC
jgi:hypothetical protein